MVGGGQKETQNYKNGKKRAMPVYTYDLTCEHMVYYLL